MSNYAHLLYPRYTSILESGKFVLMPPCTMLIYQVRSAEIGRDVLGRELATIADYRQRLNQYRTDTSLVFAHQNAPWITVW